MDAIAHAAAHLRAGGLVVMPTETVYGLAAVARDPAAVERVFEAKGRPATNPLIVHAGTLEMARGCCAHWPASADALARAFWPGPLTLVLPKAEWVPGVVTAGGETVAVRVPRHPVALALIEAMGEPLVAPSANRSGYVSPTRIEHVRGVWSEAEVFVLDGGACEVGLESTVVAVGERGLRVLRPGVIGADELARVAGVPVVEGESAGGVAASPGVVGPHYQPRARVVLVRSVDEIGDADGVVLLPPGESSAGGVRMPGEAGAYGRGLYTALREADGTGASVIVVCVPEGEGPVWDAIRERLGRAAGSR